MFCKLGVFEKSAHTDCGVTPQATLTHAGTSKPRDTRRRLTNTAKAYPSHFPTDKLCEHITPASISTAIAAAIATAGLRGSTAAGQRRTHHPGCERRRGREGQSLNLLTQLRDGGH